MSLCRWSDDDCQCQLYIFEAEGGYSINVAKMKTVWLDPLPPKIAFGQDGWLERYTTLRNLRKEHVPIGLDYDGCSFSCDTAEEAVGILTMLQEAGYIAPYETLFNILLEEYK
jgi:hypothetical protein